MSAKDNPYHEEPWRSSFYSNPEGIPVAEDELERLWAQEKMVVYFSPEDENQERTDREIKPKTKIERQMLKDLGRLSKNGGYVWVESPRGEVKVGRVRPGTEMEVISVPRQGVEEANNPSLFKVDADDAAVGGYPGGGPRRGHGPQGYPALEGRLRALGELPEPSRRSRGGYGLITGLGRTAARDPAGRLHRVFEAA